MANKFDRRFLVLVVSVSVLVLMAFWVGIVSADDGVLPQCPEGTPEPGQMISSDWLVECSHCLPTATPDPAYIIPEPPEWVEGPVHSGYCTELELLEGCYNNPLQNNCICGQFVTPTPATPEPTIGPPAPTPTPQTSHYYWIPLQDQYIGNNKTYANAICPNGDRNKVVIAKFAKIDDNGTWVWNNDTDVNIGSYRVCDNCWTGYTAEYWWRTGSDWYYLAEELLGYMPSLNWKGLKDNADFITMGFYHKENSDETWNDAGDLVEGWLLCKGTNEPIPTPEPTPTQPPHYCNEYSYINPDPLVEFPAVSISSGDCFVILPGLLEWEVPQVVQWLPAFTIGWPEVRLCPQWVAVESMSILGMNIPILELFILGLFLWFLSKIFNF